MVDIHFHAGLGSIESVYRDLEVESKAAAAGGFTYLRWHLIIGKEAANGYSSKIEDIIKNTEKVSTVDFSFNPMIGNIKQAEELDILIKKGINAFKIYYSAYKGREGADLGIYVDDDIDYVVFETLNRASKYDRTRIISMPKMVILSNISRI
ncbi:MAG: hypothetical protein QW752_04030 [Thermoplasmata archaeon]